MTAWGVVFIVLTVIQYLIVLSLKGRPRKTAVPQKNGGVVMVIFVGIFALAWQAVPFYLAIDYPFNWAAWVVTLWWAGSYIYACTRLIVGYPAQPAKVGWDYAFAVARTTAIYAAEIVLFLFAANVWTL